MKSTSEAGVLTQKTPTSNAKGVKWWEDQTIIFVFSAILSLLTFSPKDFIIFNKIETFDPKLIDNLYRA